MRSRTESRSNGLYAFGMTAEFDEGEEARKRELLRAYGLAVVEFNLASAPLIIALAAQARPSYAEVQREEVARVAVVETRRKLWASYAMSATAQSKGHGRRYAMKCYTNSLRPTAMN